MSTQKIVITGAAGNIAYSLIFRILSSSVFSRDTKIELSLLDIPEMKPVLLGLKYEIEDCAFETLHSISITDNPETAFINSDFIFLVGAKPRTKGMQRSDLLLENAQIFKAHGKIINECCKKTTKVIVVGNPANTNAFIIQNSTPNIPEKNITSLMKLDQNRAKSILATQLNETVENIRQLVVWGNHSTTQYPNIFHALVNNKSAVNDKKINEKWIVQDFIPRIQNRGAEIIEHRGKSSAASAASAIYDHFNNIVNGSNDWESLGVMSTGEYGISSEIFFSFPIGFNKNDFNVINNLDIDKLSKGYIKKSEEELVSERDIVKDILKANK
ncbi:MAG: malate dehydrogenase [Pseudomonadota bacterium]|nr:malate dehydrogenase [Pseudomonadota bacterium]